MRDNNLKFPASDFHTSPPTSYHLLVKMGRSLLLGGVLFDFC